jgi:hypothetical protein
MHDEQDTGKKKSGRKQDHSKTRMHSGSSIASTENLLVKKRSQRIDTHKEHEQTKTKAKNDDEQQVHRVPPLKIVLARAILRRTSDFER